MGISIEISIDRHVEMTNLEFTIDKVSDRSNVIMSEQTPAKSLYERLGGVYSIASVVDDFIDRIMIDPRLNSNPLVDEAHHRVSPAGFKYLVTEMSCWATGGPQQYSGRSMHESHAHLKITGEEWVAFMEDLDLTFDKFQVPKPERNEFIAIIASTKPDIVVPG